MIPPRRIRRTRAEMNGAVVLSLQIATRFPGGLFSGPSAPISVPLRAETPAGALEDALRDPLVRSSVLRLNSNRRYTRRVVMATIRRDIGATPASGTVLKPRSRIEKEKLFQGAALCVYIELTPENSQQLQKPQILETASPESGLRRSKRKRPRETPQMYAPAFESSVTSSEMSDMEEENAVSESGNAADDDCDYIVPFVSVFSRLPPREDAIMCGMLDVLSLEGRLMFPRIVEKKMMALFADLSAVLVYLQTYWALDGLRVIVPEMLLNITLENDIRPYLQRAISKVPLPKVEALTISCARENIQSNDLLSRKIPQLSRMCTSLSAGAKSKLTCKAEEESGGQLWLGSKLRKSILAFLNKFHLWDPESSPRSMTSGQKGAVPSQQVHCELPALREPDV